MGNGDGTFRAPQSYAVGTYPISVVVEDFNGDGIADLAVSVGFGEVSVLLGNGDGTFQTAQSYACVSGSLAVADFNGDGKLDLVTGGGDLLLGNGDGTFQPAQNCGGSGFAVAVGDFNRDGHLDLVVTYAGLDTVAILWATATGRFKPPRPLRLAITVRTQWLWPTSMAMASQTSLSSQWRRLPGSRGGQWL